MQALSRQPDNVRGRRAFCRAHSFFQWRSAMLAGLLVLATTVGLLLCPVASYADDGDFDFFSDQPIAEEELIIVPPPKPAWMTVGAPLALVVFFFGSCFLVRWMIPFRQTASTFDLHDLPVAAQRGIGIAVVLFGIALVFGALEAHYQVTLHDGAVPYFQQMGLGKLIAFTHAHLFGFTTSFFIIGIPFSLHFSRLKIYQWIFPIGLLASVTDILSWWGLKYVSENFEYITWACGAIFSCCYMWMLVGLLRVIFFPIVKWFPDFAAEDHQRSWDDEHPPS